jgi:hypothetical protein
MKSRTLIRRLIPGLAVTAVIGIALLTTTSTAAAAEPQHTKPSSTQLYSEWVAAVRGGVNPETAMTYAITPEFIHGHFASVIEANLAAANASQVVSRLSDRELADLASVYASRSGDTSALLEVLASGLSGAQLARTATAFGLDATSSAVAKHASDAVRQEYEAIVPRQLSKPDSARIGPRPNAAPTTDMTLTEIYLEYRTAPIGSLTPASALSETAIFAGTRLTGAFGTGWAIGSAVVPLLDTYTPDLYDAIGGTISQAIENLTTAGSLLSRGQYEGAIDSMFGGFTMSWGNSTRDWTGDWGVSSAFDFFMRNSDGHCQNGIPGGGLHTNICL